MTSLIKKENAPNIIRDIERATTEKRAILYLRVDKTAGLVSDIATNCFGKLCLWLRGYRREKEGINEKLNYAASQLSSLTHVPGITELLTKIERLQARLNKTQQTPSQSSSPIPSSGTKGDCPPELKNS
jgi:hypothetical protein